MAAVDQARQNTVREQALESSSPELLLMGAPARVDAEVVFKTGHYATRLAVEDLSVNAVESVVANEIQSIASSVAASAPFSGRMVVDNVLIEYRAALRPNGQINVGTIFPVK